MEPLGKRRGVAWLVALAMGACARSEPGSGPDGASGGAPADEDAIVQVIREGEIEAIDAPVFAPVRESAEFMMPEEPVAGVVLGGVARAYSLWHLDRHEVVNDRAGDLPLVVAWCPLAYTARVFERRAAGRELTFGVSGRLWRNALVMRDRETGTLWSQVNGAALEGALAGAELPELPVGVASWAEWSRLHPGTLVLRKPKLTGTLYPDYFADPLKLGYYGRRNLDPRLPAKAHVIGVERGGGALAVPLDALRMHPVWNAETGGTPVLLVSLGFEGPELAYVRAAAGRELTFDPLAGKGSHSAPLGRDRETGSTWDLRTGGAVSGPLAGARLRPVPAQRAYWFIWSAYYPGTLAVGTPQGAAQN